MYTIMCDDYPIFDSRVDELALINPKVKLEVNTVCEASFVVYKNHPHYNTLFPLRSIITIYDDKDIIFRGRITNDTTAFNGGKTVDIEGVLGFLNDSVVRPYTFPDDFENNEEYKAAAAEGGNVVEYFLKWLIDNHNEQVTEFQQFKLGKVTVKDNNNYIIRLDSDYKKTWEIVKTKLFESSLGGYLCIRYEEDGNYIDYLNEFESTNTQSIEYGENLLDIQTDASATETYSAIIPLGAADEEENKRLTIDDYPHEEVMAEYKKKGDVLYNQKAVEQYGWIFAPVSDTTWDDIHEINNLVNHGVIYLWEHLNKTVDTIDISAVDLHYTDEQIQGLRIYRNVKVKSLPHGHNSTYPLTKLDIDILNPQNTKITVGRRSASLIDYNIKDYSKSTYKAETAEKIAKESGSNTKKLKTYVEENFIEKSTYNQFKTSLTEQEILWSASDGKTMSADDIITFSSKISEESIGIQLVFSQINSNVFQSFFIPKQMILSSKDDECFSFNLIGDGFSCVGLKQLYIDREKITGHTTNDLTGISNTGITFDNLKFVLRCVIGV